MTFTFQLSFRRTAFGILLCGLLGWLGWHYRLERALVQASRSEGVSRQLLWAVAMQETRMRGDVTGAAGEIGLMQVMPSTAAQWAKEHDRNAPTGKQLFRPKLNARIGAWYLRKGLDEYADTEDPLAYALAYYNAGPTRVRKWKEELPPGIPFERYIPFPSTRKYVRQVKERL